MTEHSTVLLHEAIDALVVDPDGLYVDGTFGRGGHTAELLSRLSVKGSVIAIDKDLDAIASGSARFADDDRLSLVHGTFADLTSIVEQAVGLAGEADTLLPDFKSDRPVAIVLGAEGKGLRELVRESCETLVSIPISSTVESLNVSTAASISLYALTQ